jgi:hypothetical protein
MACTTFLHDSELNQPLPNAEVQEFLDLARQQTGEDWQVVPITFSSRKWFKTQYNTLYGVYVYVGGIGPWQQINFYKAGSGTSLNLYVSLEVVAAYFMGMVTSQTNAKT